MHDTLSDELLAVLRSAIAEGETIPTIAQGKPNVITRIAPEGVFIETEKSRREQQGPQLVPAWMIETAWEHLQAQGSLTAKELLASDGLNVKRSSAVCALLARLPEVQVASTQPIRLEVKRGA